MSVLVVILCIYALVGVSLNGIWLYFALKMFGSYEVLLEDILARTDDQKLHEFVDSSPRLAVITLKYLTYPLMAISWPYFLFSKRKGAV